MPDTNPGARRAPAAVTMPEPLKHQLGPETVTRLAERMAAAWPAFPEARFVADALDGYEPLELLARGNHLADALRRHLPADVPTALAVLADSLGPPLERASGNGMSPFFYLAHTAFLGRHATGHPDAALPVMRALTQRFTAEWCIRPFLERDPDRMLAVLDRWIDDESEHVRRLVSEGTRPRLPWGARLRVFGADPGVMLPRLARLRDDPSDYVRRSVSNHLHDIGKDHPNVLLDTAAAWWSDDVARRVLVRHALRTLVKTGDPRALGLLGATEAANVIVTSVGIQPEAVNRGGRVELTWTVQSTSPTPQRVVVDIVVHYVKARGHTQPKVFKGRTLDLAPGSSVAMRHTLSLEERTTRRHHPGEHRVALRINGSDTPLGVFVLS